MSFSITGTHADAMEEMMQKATAQDISPANNLGSFVTTSQDSAATRLMALNSDKHHACVGEYTSIANFHQDCVSMLADLYFDIEVRVIPVNEDTGVFLKLGSIYTGHYDPVKVAACLDGYEARTGYNIPIHVDAASRGFVAPFTHGNTVDWDFNLPRVRSINDAGHKFGLATCAVGWVVWRDRSFVPESLILEPDYLRWTQLAFTLSFSRPNAPVAVQYYHLRRLGRDGYQKAIYTLLSTARELSFRLEDTGYYRCISDIHRKFEFHVSLCSVHSHLLIAVDYELNGRGKNGQNIDVLRIVVRSSAIDEMMEKIVAELVDVVEELESVGDHVTV
ncbi:hypothetical protein MW887_008707 [Aspergillus wentii]|nr:hypothetical protein MW887_008707 [Aspergillus wentii]